MIRVLIADDHAVVRQGLRTYLDLQDDIDVVAEAGDGDAAIAAATRRPSGSSCASNRGRVGG